MLLGSLIVLVVMGLSLGLGPDIPDEPCQNWTAAQLEDILLADKSLPTVEKHVKQKLRSISEEEIEDFNPDVGWVIFKKKPKGDGGVYVIISCNGGVEFST